MLLKSRIAATQFDRFTNQTYVPVFFVSLSACKYSHRSVNGGFTCC